MYSRIVLSTDIPELISFIKTTGIPIKPLKNPPKDEHREREIAPDDLYVLAYKNPTSEKLRFLATHAGKHENFLAVCSRPGSGITLEELGETITVSRESIQTYTKRLITKLLTAPTA